MKTLLSVTVVCLGLWWAGCTVLNKSIANQNGVVDQTHERYNSGEYESIWAAAHPRFQGEIDKAGFAQYLRKVHEKLGSALSTANKERRFSTANQKTLVFLVQQTAFEKGSAIETFTLQMNGDEAILVAYNVQSKLLDTR